MFPSPKLSKLVYGMKAEIFTDPRPNQPYQGQVGYILPEDKFAPQKCRNDKTAHLAHLLGRIVAKTPDDGLWQGMPVTVRLLLAQWAERLHQKSLSR